jgi:hypothetical protein
MKIKGNAWMAVTQLDQMHSIIIWVGAAGWVCGVLGDF